MLCAALVHPHGFVLFDVFTLADPLEDFVRFAAAVRWNKRSKTEGVSGSTPDAQRPGINQLQRTPDRLLANPTQCEASQLRCRTDQS